MTRQDKKQAAIAGKGTPSESDRRVLKRSDDRASEGPPDDVGSGEEPKIEPVDLSLHGNGVDHWQDELPSERNPRREREGKVPSKPRDR